MLAALSGMAMILLLGLAIILPINAIEYTLPECLLLDTEKVCKITYDVKDVKIVDEGKEKFPIAYEIQQQFNNLEELDLSDIGAMILDGFKAFPNLISLNISGGQLEALEGTHFNKKNKLEHLDASWNLLKELNFGLKSKLLYLKTANFSHNAIAFIENDTWRTFQELKRLHLDNNELKTINLHNYPMLETVTLSDNQIEELTSKSFQSVNKLEELVITANPLFNIGDRAFESLLNLRILNLSANSLEQLSSEVFAGLRRLIQLDLSLNNLKEVSNLQFQYLAKLQYLDISRNSLTTLNSTNFIGLSNLRKLYIFENYIKEMKSNTFAKLAALDTLDLSYNAIEYIEGDLFGSFTLPRLKKLLLKSNNLKLLQHLAFTSLPFLQYISLGHNELTTLDARMFAPMRRLEKLDLDNNLLETIPSEVLDSLTDISELLLNNNRLSFLSDTNATFNNLIKVSIEGNPWQCPCLEDITKWLQDRRISYVRLQSPYYRGQKPLCVVTPVNVCVKNLKLVREYKVEDIYNKDS